MTRRLATPGPPARGAVLVVEDEAPNLTFLVRLLTVEGYDVRTAVDGESACRVLREAPACADWQRVARLRPILAWC